MQHPSPRNHTFIIALGVMTLSLVGGLACPGNLDPAFFQNTTGAAGMGGGGSSGGCTDAPMIMMKTCADNIICHKSGGASAGGLDLSSDQATRLLGVASTGMDMAVCPAGQIYLNPHTNPATGYFIDKLNGPGCDLGNQMPYLTTWTDQQHQCVVDWATSITAP